MIEYKRIRLRNFGVWRNFGQRPTSLWLGLASMYAVYLLKSIKNNKSYIGFTEKHPQERLKEHNNGSNKWTSENGPFILKYYETFICKDDALRREKFFKSGQGRKLNEIILERF